MKVLNYLEAHTLIEQVAKDRNLILTDEVRSRIIKLSGRLDLWLPSLTKLFGNNPKTTNHQALSHLKSLHLLEPVFEHIPPQEHLYLLPPASPPKSSWLVRHNFHSGKHLFSPLFTTWLQHQPVRETHLLTSTPLTPNESKILACLYDHQGLVVSRDKIASVLWGEDWYGQYSDWTIDTNIHHIRSKLLPHWQLVTIRNRGHLLKSRHTKSTHNLSSQEDITPITRSSGFLPTKDYLNYMNNPYNPRKVYQDLFSALRKEGFNPRKIVSSPTPTILAINSYSFDNVDTLVKLFPHATAYFTGFDERSLEIHQERIKELAIDTFHALYDDIRTSRLEDSSFDLVINDFRLNWNINHQEDLNAMKNMHRILQDQGTLLLSVVVDARYESDKFGQDQEKAPLNTHKPWHFMGQEGLERYCHTVPYYKDLIQESGFSLVQEFDIEEGKSWSLGKIMVDPLTRPSFRRFLLQK